MQNAYTHTHTNCCFHYLYGHYVDQIHSLEPYINYDVLMCIMGSSIGPTKLSDPTQTHEQK